MRKKWTKGLTVVLLAAALCAVSLSGGFSSWTTGITAGGRVCVHVPGVSSVTVTEATVTLTTYSAANEDAQEEQQEEDGGQTEPEDTPSAVDPSSDAEAFEPEPEPEDLTGPVSETETQPEPEKPETSDESEEPSVFAEAERSNEDESRSAAEDENIRSQPTPAYLAQITTETGTAADDASEVSFPQITLTSAMDSADYAITLRNDGTNAVRVESYHFLPSATDQLLVLEHVDGELELAPGESVTLYVSLRLSGEDSADISAKLTIHYTLPEIERAPSAGSQIKGRMAG